MENNLRNNEDLVSTGQVVFEENVKHMDNNAEFTNITLSEEGHGDAEQPKKKVPRRILHFSDGILEEYSTDEEEDVVDSAPTVDPNTLNWLPWLWFYMLFSGNKALQAADFCGERLAWFFGITSPKYQYAIDEARRMEQEDKEEQEREAREREADEQRQTADMVQMEEVVTDNKPCGVHNKGFVHSPQDTSHPTKPQHQQYGSVDKY